MSTTTVDHVRAFLSIRGWLRAYRHGGFDALLPKERADAGSTRAIPSHVVDLLCQLKDDEPALTIPLLIKRVRDEHRAIVSDEVVLAESTVHRLLARRGLTRKPSEPTSKDHRRRIRPRRRAMDERRDVRP